MDAATPEKSVINNFGSQEIYEYGGLRLTQSREFSMTASKDFIVMGCPSRYEGRGVIGIYDADDLALLKMFAGAGSFKDIGRSLSIREATL